MISAHLQIVGRIVQAILVAVMNLFSPKNGTPDGSFGYDDVLKHVALPIGARVVRLQHLTVTLLNDLAGSIEAARAKARAEFSNLFSVSWCSEVCPAIQTRKRNRRRSFARVRGNVSAEVVFSAEPTPEMNRVAVGNLADAPWLWRMRAATLPDPVAAHGTKGTVHLLATARSIKVSLATITDHIHILIRNDGNHYSVEHEGRK